MIDYNLKKIFVELTSIDTTSGYEKPVADYIQNFVKKDRKSVGRERVSYEV